MTLFNQLEVTKILSRIERLTPETQNHWGKMDVNQMLAHCNEVLETAMGKNFPKRIFIGRILSPFMKAKFLSESEFPKKHTDRRYLSHCR